MRKKAVGGLLLAVGGNCLWLLASGGWQFVAIVCGGILNDGCWRLQRSSEGNSEGLTWSNCFKVGKVT